MSQATKSVLLFIRLAMKATLRASRSNLAIKRVALALWHAATQRHHLDSNFRVANPNVLQRYDHQPVPKPVRRSLE